MFNQSGGLLAFLRSESGVTAIEYALIGSLIALLIVLGVTLLGQKVQSLYDTIAASMP